MAACRPWRPPASYFYQGSADCSHTSKFLVDRPRPSPTVPSLDGPTILFPTMFILQPSLRDALRREVEGALEISSPHPFPGSGTKVRRAHSGEFPWPERVRRRGKNLESFPEQSPPASQSPGPQSRVWGRSAAHTLFPQTSFPSSPHNPTPWTPVR